MQGRQKGFTIIELIVVIVILGILAATALPRFVNLQEEANIAAVQGVAGAISSANAINVAAFLTNSAKAQRPIDNCDDGGQLLEGGMPAGYTITGLAVGQGNPGSTVTNCVVTRDGESANFTITGLN